MIRKQASRFSAVLAAAGLWLPWWTAGHPAYLVTQRSVTDQGTESLRGIDVVGSWAITLVIGAAVAAVVAVIALRALVVAMPNQFKAVPAVLLLVAVPAGFVPADKLGDTTDRDQFERLTNVGSLVVPVDDGDSAGRRGRAAGRVLVPDRRGRQRRGVDHATRGAGRGSGQAHRGARCPARGGSRTTGTDPAVSISSTSRVPAGSRWSTTTTPLARACPSPGRGTRRDGSWQVATTRRAV